MPVKVMAPNMTWFHLENFTVTGTINSKFIMSLAYSYTTTNKKDQVNNVLNNVGIGNTYYYGEEKIQVLS